MTAALERQTHTYKRDTATQNRKTPQKTPAQKTRSMYSCVVHAVRESVPCMCVCVCACACVRVCVCVCVCGAVYLEQWRAVWVSSGESCGEQWRAVWLSKWGDRILGQ